MELTIAQARSGSAGFMYIWADENKFLRYIPKKYAKIIRGKKANQNKLIMLSAEKYNKKVSDYTQAIREQFIEDYGMTPAEALIVLAQGGTVAGKNWREGVFGIGKTINENGFGVEINDKPVVVNMETGEIMCGMKNLTDTTRTVYKKVNGKVIPYQLFGYDNSGDDITFMSQYDSKTKTYKSASWSNSEGTYSPEGTPLTAKDGADIWGNVNNLLDKFLDWLLKLFGVDKDTQLISASNTLPSQTEDGFITKAEAGGILLALAAGGALLASSFFGNKKSDESK